MIQNQSKPCEKDIPINHNDNIMGDKNFVKPINYKQDKLQLKIIENKNKFQEPMNQKMIDDAENSHK